VRENTPGKSHYNLKVLSPVIIPFNSLKIIRKINKYFVNKEIFKAIISMGFKEYILLSSHPNVVDYFTDHKKALKIYYCVDDFTVIPGVDNKLIEQMEIELINESNIILYTARILKEKFQNAIAETHYLPHGVDNEHFSVKEPINKFPDIKKPIIGFFGLLSEWVDFDLIIEVAKIKKEWSFLFIGNSEINTQRADDIDNIYLIGPVPYSELPVYASSFDVGLIPFKINKLTKAVNPLKFLEYMALGIPVVSTPLPELMQFKDYVYFGTNTDEIISAINSALSSLNDSQRAKRIHLAGLNSWENRSQQLLNIIANYADNNG
jgi:glycosyltransferase involved in cell wall biosynthesis